MTETDMSRDARLHAELVQRRAFEMLYRRRAQALEDLLQDVIDETSSEDPARAAELMNRLGGALQDGSAREISLR